MRLDRQDNQEYLFEMFRDVFINSGFRKESRILKNLYGQDNDGRTPHGFSFFYDLYSKVAKDSKKSDDASGAKKLKEIMLIFIDDEMERLKEWEKRLNDYQRQNLECKLSAAVIPDPKAMDLLMRYETHISREIDRIITRVERSQRMYARA